jgi:hypothetical protein
MRNRVPFLLLVIGGLISAQTIFAQGGSIGISPLIFELSGNQGEVIENILKVYNPSSDSTIQVRMQVEDIAPSGDSGQVTVEPAESESYSLASWVQYDKEEFSLSPREEKIIKFTIVVPKNAEPGGHYGSILAGVRAIAGIEATGSLILPRVGSLILLTIPGEIKENLTIKDFSAPRYSEYGPINFTFRFENKGTAHVKPTGLITITNWLGKKVADVGFSSKNVLPGAVRKFETSWENKWIFGGRYTATLSGSYGALNTPFIPSVITFWVFPWKVGAGIILVIIFFIITRRRWLSAFRILIKGEK